jgi:hypothetical protein
MTEKGVSKAEKVSEWLDEIFRIPFTRFRFGLDPIIGLAPGIGDAAGAILSAFIVYSAAKLGVSKTVIVKMYINILIDSIVGSIPGLGDFFDFTWKCNTRNVSLLDESLETADSERSKRGAANVVAGILVLGVLLIYAIPVVILLYLWQPL